MQPITTLAMCLTLQAAVTCSAADGALRTNAIAGRTTVAVLRFLPEEPALMDPRDAHWLRTFSGLVASDLRQVAALRVLPEGAVLRELARQKTAEPNSVDTVAGMRKLGENLRAECVVVGALTRTGSVWTASAHVVEAAPGKSGQRLGASSTNWFELRELVVRQILQHLNITPSTEEQKLMGRVWTSSAKALEWCSQVASDPNVDAEQRAELCRKALAEDANFIEAGAFFAVALYDLGHNEECLKAAGEVLRQKPDRYRAAQVHGVSAAALLQLQRENEAQQSVAEGLRLWPENSELLLLQYILYDNRRDLQAAGDCLRKASEYDPGNPRMHALLARNLSRQGDLTNALASLELAEELAPDTAPEERLNIEVTLAEANESVGKLAEALRHYRRALAEAQDWGAPESRIKWVRETVSEMERRSEPVPVVAGRPKSYSPAELQAVLRERLSPEELVVAVNPIAATPEMARWAAEIVGETRGDLARARKLFEHLVARPRANGGSTRTAQEVFAAWKDLGQFFQCQEYAKLFTALARSLDLPAFYVHVERDYCDRIVDHDCAVVFAEGKAWLADPAYMWFGVPHLEFQVLDDVQTVAHHAFQPHDGKPEVALCRAGCKLDPEFTWGRWNLVMALIESDQAEEARKELDRARQSAPENWRGYQLEGLMAVKQVQNERAVEWLRKAAEANPDAGDTHLLLGLALFRSGQQAAAREELLAGLRKPHRRESQELATETLTLIEEALGLSSNVPGTSKSALTAATYHNLGVSFLYGPQPNYTEAAKWLRKAAEMGDPNAQGTLGVLYWNGRGVPQDPVIAVGWLRKAADSGEAEAMRNLGKAYDQGLGIEKDQNEAMRWMRRAAEAGDAQAQAILGKACYEGWNTPKNLVEALSWLRLAEEGYATPSEGNFGETDRAPALRKVRYLLKEVELFTSSEEKTEANAWMKSFKAKQAPLPGAQRTPTVPPADPGAGAATDPK